MCEGSIFNFAVDYAALLFSLTNLQSLSFDLQNGRFPRGRGWLHRKEKENGMRCPTKEDKNMRLSMLETREWEIASPMANICIFLVKVGAKN